MFPYYYELALMPNGIQIYIFLVYVKLFPDGDQMHHDLNKALETLPKVFMAIKCYHCFVVDL